MINIIGGSITDMFAFTGLQAILREAFQQSQMDAKTTLFFESLARKSAAQPMSFTKK